MIINNLQILEKSFSCFSKPPAPPDFFIFNGNFIQILTSFYQTFLRDSFIHKKITFIY